MSEVGLGSETAVPVRRRRDRSASISGPPPAETALQATARAVDATRTPHPGRANSASDSFPWVGAAPGSITMFVVLLCAGSHAGTGEDRKDVTEHDTDQNLA